MSLIAITEVKKRFGDNEVLKGISIDIASGEVVAIIGKSGSGKSTLLRCINGLETIDEGSIVVAGAQFLPDEVHLKALRLKVGMIFQQFNLFPHLTAGGNVMLSQMVVKKALAMQPIALLCDEITSALDPELVAEVLAVVRELAAEGMTLVMVTHEMRFARDVCSRVVFMHQGRVHEIGAPEEVFANPRTPELRQFLGVQ
ncbi:MAG: amino acid ABC transporter ATP-binding protein [Mesorhizobium sp.]|nr:MAG: amino acid ABC transporter ATP-binding protein [Mesorhizobium sp.]